GVRDVVDQLLPKLVGAETQARRPGVVDEARAVALAQSAAGVVGALGALRDRPDARPALGQGRGPTLGIVGSGDVLTPPAVAGALADGIPGARLETIGGAGHLSNLERPDAFNAALRSFLQALP